MKVWWMLIVWLMLFGCYDRHAGSASVTTNGTVAGSVVDSLGTAQQQVNAYLIPLTMDPAAAANYWLSQTTDSNGNYVFDSVPIGEYRLVVRSDDSSQAATIDYVVVDSAEEVTLTAVPLTQVGALQVNANAFAFAVGDRFYVPGTDMAKTVTAADVAAGLVKIAGVPSGTYAQIMYMPVGSLSSLPMLATAVTVATSPVTVIPDYEATVSVPMGFVTVARGTLASYGGALGDTVSVSDTAALRKAISDTLPKVILITKMIPGNGDMLRIASNKTILGIGDSAGLDSLGFSVRTDSNIVIRNLNFRSGAIDAISMEDSANHIWIDHNTFDAYGDGLIDAKRASDYITVSWNHFRKHRMVSLIGHSDANGAEDSLHLQMTYHHNWFEQVENTSPRVRYGSVHILNNYYDSISGFAVASTQYAKVVLQSNYFRAVKTTTVIKHTSAHNGDLISIGDFLDRSGTPATYGTAFDPATKYTYTVDDVTKIRGALILGSGAGRLKSLYR